MFNLFKKKKVRIQQDPEIIEIQKIIESQKKAVSDLYESINKLENEMTNYFKNEKATM